MYRQYVCDNDNVYISDNKGNLTIRKYSDNINEVLNKENEIEVLKVEMNKENNEKEQLEKGIKSKKVLLSYLIASFGLPVVIYAVTNVGSKILLTPDQLESLMVHTPRFPEGINSLSIFSLEVGLITIPLGVIGTIIETVNNHLSRLNIRTKNEEIEEIQSLINKKNEELSELNNYSKQDNEYKSGRVKNTNAEFINGDMLRVLKK